jgi:hypothetical protein
MKNANDLKAQVVGPTIRLQEQFRINFVYPSRVRHVFGRNNFTDLSVGRPQQQTATFVGEGP